MVECATLWLYERIGEMSARLDVCVVKLVSFIQRTLILCLCLFMIRAMKKKMSILCVFV